MPSRRDILAASAALAALAFDPPSASAVARRPTPPRAAKLPKTITQAGRTRVDEYHWMKDDNWQQVLKDPAVLRADIREHLLKENAWFDACMADTKALQARLFEEMKGRLPDDDSSAPVPDGPWAYYSRFDKGAQQRIHARRPLDGGEEEILLDINALAEGQTYFDVGTTTHSPDHRMFAWTEDTAGAGIYRIRVRDIRTGKMLGTPMDGATGDFVFSPDSQYIFWTWQDENARPVKIFRRPARGGEDTVVYEEADPGMFLGVTISASRNFILIVIQNHETAEHRIIPASHPLATPIVFAERRTAELYMPVDFDGRWYIRTNADGAVDFKIMSAPHGTTGRQAWEEFIPHEPGRYIASLTARRHHLVRLERRNALPRIVIRHRDGTEHAIAQDEAAYALELEDAHANGSDTIRFVYQSPTTPRQWIDYDMTTRTRTLCKAQPVPSGHDPSRYRVERFAITAPDGAEIPVTLLALKATKPGSGAPMMLYGYGSHGWGVEASFGISRLSLVDRGWIYAIAHVRGGDEKGRSWFEGGRKKTKVNTFKDFIAVAEGLVARGDARRGKIVTYGISAGGLLVGAVANLAPEGLFGGHIAVVPFVDVLNTMSDPSLPLTPPEWPEWGNPIENPEDYDTILAYSPYDQVAPRRYPPIYASGGLTDSRVTYWEPAKWIARLRDRAPHGGPYFLATNMTAGHTGSAGRYDGLRDGARDYAFALKAVGDPEAGATLT